MAFAYFDADGRLLSITTMQTQYPDPEVHEQEVTDETDANSIYLDLATNKLSKKQPFDVTTAYNRIAGLPVGTVIMVNDMLLTVDDGEIEFEADTPEELLVYIDHPHFVAQYLTVPTGPEVS